MRTHFYLHLTLQNSGTKCSLGSTRSGYNIVRDPSSDRTPAALQNPFFFFHVHDYPRAGMADTVQQKNPANNAGKKTEHSIIGPS